MIKGKLEILVMAFAFVTGGAISVIENPLMGLLVLLGVMMFVELSPKLSILKKAKKQES